MNSKPPQVGTCLCVSYCWASRRAQLSPVQHRAAKSQQTQSGVLGQTERSNVLVTAARRPILTCAHHLGIRHWVPRRVTGKHPACWERGLPR